MAEDIDLLLRTAPVFRKLGPEDRRRLAEVARHRVFARGDTIFSEGEPPDAFCVIVKGRAKVCKMTPAGKDVILEIFGPGDPLGAIAVYDGQPYPATAIAIEHTSTVSVPRQAFFALLEQHPTMVRGLLAGLTHRLIELANRVAELSGGRVEPRFARLFIKLADEQGRTERGGVFIPVPLSRQELADMTGTTIETSIRIMSRWGKQHTVHTEKDGFLVLDRHELETLALT
ncbi:MAG: Crp/Fnr family transcriptional regulator [Acidobacteria bacterium]|nr:Crp/Fnr family transcriptional regulator [Acidobacteriota bacterium]